MARVQRTLGQRATSRPEIWFIACNRHALHYPAGGEVVGNRQMLADPIVPECDRALLPTEAALDFDIPGGLVQLVEHPRAFVLREALDMAGEAIVDIDHPLARFGMRADHRVAHGRKSLVQIGRRLIEALGKDAGDVVDGSEPFAKPLHLFAQSLISEMHIGKARVAAAFRHFARHQNGAQRRLCAPRHIGMPIVFLPPAFRTVGDAQDFGIRLIFGSGGMDFQFAKFPRKGDVLFLREVLVTKKITPYLSNAARISGMRRAVSAELRSML